MIAAITTAFLLAGVLLVMALLVVWARRRTWLRTAAIPLAIVASGVSALTVGGTLGYAVPLIGGVTAPAGEAVLRDVKLIISNGIYVTLDFPEGPRLYWLPWSKKLAEELQEMMSESGGAEGLKMIVPPFEFSWDQSEPDFQPLPQPKVLPDKPPAPPQALRFDA